MGLQSLGLLCLTGNFTYHNLPPTNYTQWNKEQFCFSKIMFYPSKKNIFPLNLKIFQRYQINIEHCESNWTPRVLLLSANFWSSDIWYLLNTSPFCKGNNLSTFGEIRKLPGVVEGTLQTQIEAKLKKYSQNGIYRKLTLNCHSLSFCARSLFLHKYFYHHMSSLLSATSTPPAKHFYNIKT